MSIIKPEWDEADSSGLIPDKTLHNLVYFGPDAYLWTISDFIQVEGETETEDTKQWHVVLRRVDKKGSFVRRTITYDRLINSGSWMRVRNPEADIKPINYRGRTLDAQKDIDAEGQRAAIFHQPGTVEAPQRDDPQTVTDRSGPQGRSFVVSRPQKGT